MTNDRSDGNSRRDFPGHWSLDIPWSLVIGNWSLTPGCIEHWTSTRRSAYVFNNFMSDPAQVLRDFKPSKEFFIGIDSDGCIFDSMEIKHKECFAPMFIKNFHLQPVSKYAREVWEFVNLYSKDRGANRFADPFGDGRRVEKADVLGPGNAEHHPQVMGLGPIEQPPRRYRERTDHVGTELGHERKISLDHVALGELRAMRSGLEGAVGDRLHVELLVAREKELALNLEGTGLARGCECNRAGGMACLSRCHAGGKAINDIPCPLFTTACGRQVGTS